MDDDARRELASIIDRLSLKARRAISQTPEENLIILHHGLGTAIRNRIRAGELRALFRWSCAQVPHARSLDDRAWPIIVEIGRVLRSSHPETGERPNDMP
jgi:hypothetical protein